MGYGPNQVYVQKALTNYAVRYTQEMNNFIADKVMPPIVSKNTEGKYFKFGRGDSWSIADSLRAPSSESKRTRVTTITTGTYSIDRHSFHEYVSQDEIDNADAPLTPLQDVSAELMEKLMVIKENSLGALMALTSSVGTAVSQPAATKWNATSTATPIDDVRTAKTTVLKETGRVPNVVIMGQETWDGVADADTIIDRVKYVQKGFLDQDLVASALGVEELLVGSAVKNVAPETAGGSDSLTTNFIWGKHCWVLYRPRRPLKKVAAYGYNFTFKNQGIVVKNWWDRDVDSYKVEADARWDFNITSSICAYGFYNVVV